MNSHGRSAYLLPVIFKTGEDIKIMESKAQRKLLGLYRVDVTGYSISLSSVDYPVMPNIIYFNAPKIAEGRYHPSFDDDVPQTDSVPIILENGFASSPTITTFSSTSPTAVPPLYYDSGYACGGKAFVAAKSLPQKMTFFLTTSLPIAASGVNYMGNDGTLQRLKVASESVILLDCEYYNVPIDISAYNRNEKLNVVNQPTNV